jgi:hypothetical protein
VQLRHLLLRHLHLLERGGDLLDGQESPLLGLGDQRAQLVDLVNRGFVRQQCIGFRAQPLILLGT